MSENMSEKVSVKKPFFKSKKGIIVIIVAVVVLLLAGGGVILGSYLIPKDISGAWELVVNPEISEATRDELPEKDKVYYIFDKPDKYGRGEYRTCYQGGVEVYEYELMEKDSVTKINLGTEDMEYSISGSKLLGDAKLKIIYPRYTDEETGVTYDEQEYIFEQASDPDYENQAYKSYKTDKSIVGTEYTSNERFVSYYFYTFPYVQSVEFMSNGVMVIHYESEMLGLDRNMYYAYSAEDNVITFSLVTDKDTKYTVSYEKDENQNLKFSNDKTSDSLFADAFFGDYTFYTAENLPEAPVSSADEIYYAE
ncbi:MAG: hypothetical protein E7532_00015 [Ruminococcaceae bacterium]|nr:hypothetical protein [Oscillospiraceae bacterium]